MVDSAVRLFRPETEGVPRKVRDYLRIQWQSEAEQLAEGFAADFSDYSRRVGRLAAIKDAIAVCEKVDKEMRS